MQKILINGVEIWQPNEGIQYSLETTYTEDTQRIITGPIITTPLFTVEQLSYEASWIPVASASAILQMVIGLNFQLTYFSPYYGGWRTAEFYVGKGSMNIGRLNPEDMVLESLSFNMQGVNPI